MEIKTTMTIKNLYTTPTHTAYDVTCFNHRIRTIVTRNPTIVTSWLTHIRNHNPHSTTVGLDTEWLNPVAILQLCVGPNCLIWQISHSPSIPTAVRDFLGDPKWKFSGVGVAGDAKRLAEDYALAVATVVDVSRAAANEGLVRVNAGLKEVAKVVLGWEVEKPKEVTLSKWDNEVLDEVQVKYACVDAFVSYMIAKKLFLHHHGVDHDHVEDGDHRVDCQVFAVVDPISGSSEVDILDC